MMSDGVDDPTGDGDPFLTGARDSEPLSSVEAEARRRGRVAVLLGTVTVMLVLILLAGAWVVGLGLIQP